MPSRAYQTNAADRAQGRRAERMAKRQEQRYFAALGVALEHAEVRLALATLVERAAPLTTSYEPTASAMYFNEGARNFGLQLLADCERANARCADLMEQERRARKRADDREVDAWHAPSIDAEESSDGEDPSS
jgi:hypothetical protein